MADKQEMHRKIIGVPLQKGMQKGEDGFLIVRGYFTSDQRDEVGDIITRTATERAIPRFRQWGNIRRMHAPDPVGRVTRIGTDDGLEWNEVEIKVIDPKASFEVENGLLQALSIGALIKFEDVEFLEDGGWVINDYQLAEISLVDHPANYDARLALSLGLDEATRNRAREEGLLPTLRSMGITLREEKSMEQETVETPAEAVEKAVEETPAPVAVAEEAPVAEADKAVDAVASEAPAEAEAPVAETETEKSEPVTPELDAVVAQMKSVLDEFSKTLNTSFEKMIEAIGSISKAQIAEAPEAPVAEPEVQAEAKALEAEAQSPVETVVQPSREDLEAKNASLIAEKAALEARIAELETPVERKGLIPVEEAPEATPEAEAEKSVEDFKAMSLRDAVTKFFETKSR